MKLTTLLMIIGLLQVSAKSFSQISLNESNVPISKVFRSLEKQSGYSFIYDADQIKDPSITINVSNVTLEVALDQCLKYLPLTYRILDKNVVVTAKSVLPDKKPEITKADTAILVTGKVLDESGHELPGTTIQIKGPGNSVTITNATSGQFKVITHSPNVVLVVSYIGYETQEIPLKGRHNLTITMVKAVNGLDAVRVIAYGKDTKRFSVGSVATVSAAEIEQQPVTNPLLALEGRVPGLTITPTNGAPGSSVQVQVRGQNSLISNSNVEFKPYDQPLILIDGVPFAAQGVNINQLSSLVGNNLGGAYAGISPINNINPNDIESISVLKDAEATSIYGTQGANGVILITTKKGKAGPTTVNASVNSGVNVVTRPVQMLNTQQYLALRKEALKNDGIDLSTANATDYPDLLLFDQNKNTDFFKQYEGKSSNSTDAHVSLSGGSANTTFLTSAGYTTTGYDFPGDFSDKRMTIHTGLHHNSADSRFTMDLGFDYTYDNNNNAANPNITQGILTPPNYPNLLDANGNLVWNYKGFDLAPYQNYAYLDQPSDVQSYTLNSSLNLGYRILSELRFNVNLGYSRLTVGETQQFPLSSMDPTQGYGSSSANFSNSTYQTINIEPQLNYSHNFNKGQFTALLGGTYKKNINESTSLQATGYTDDALLGSLAAATNVYAKNADNPYKYAGVFARIGYIYDEKYIISLSGRRDGSSNFGPGKQFGDFGALGMGWIFSAEKSVKDNLPFLSFGKLYGSYGTSGSDATSPYQYQPFWQSIPYVPTFQGTRPLAPVNLYNPDYSWDNKKTLNIGLDLGFLKNRILLNVTWYQDRIGDQLTNYTLPSQTGFPSVIENFNATIQNRGLEATLTTNNISTTNFKWSTNFNISGNRNTLLAFPGLATSPYSTLYAIGKSTSTVFGYKYKDVNPQTGVYEFYAANGTTTYNPVYGLPSQGGDLVPIANTDPKFQGGFGNTFTYKKFSLYLFFNFVNQVGPNYLSAVYSLQNEPGGFTNVPAALLNHWRQPGDISNIQRVSAAYDDASTALGYFETSSGAYSNASFVRLKTVSFSYSLPSSFQTKLGMNNCKVFVNAQNLLTFTGYQVGDPELPGGLYQVPLQRTIVLGLSSNF